jgi:hypothetical protein
LQLEKQAKEIAKKDNELARHHKQSLKALVSKGLQLDLACCGTRSSHTGWLKCIDAKMIKMKIQLVPFMGKNLLNGQTKFELTHQEYCATLVKKTRQ